MGNVKSGKIHFYVGVISIVLIIITGTIMALTTVAEAIVWLLFVLIIAPLVYLWISNVRKHDHGYNDRDFRRWNKK